jgi:hypothetical protein
VGWHPVLGKLVQGICILCVLCGPTSGKGPGRVPWTGLGAMGRQGRGKLVRENRILRVLCEPTSGMGPGQVPWTGLGAAWRQGRGKLVRENRILRVPCGPTSGMGPGQVPWTGPGAAWRQGRGKLVQGNRILRILFATLGGNGGNQAVSAERVQGIRTLCVLRAHALGIGGSDIRQRCSNWAGRRWHDGIRLVVRIGRSAHEITTEGCLQAKMPRQNAPFCRTCTRKPHSMRSACTRSGKTAEIRRFLQSVYKKSASCAFCLHTLG